MNTSPKILVVEDEILIADYIQELLNDFGYSNLQQANSKEEATEKLVSFEPDIVLMDINLNGHSEGIELSENEFKEQKIIFLTAQNDKQTVQQAIKTNPLGYLTKPIKRTDLLATIQLGINNLTCQKQIEVKYRNINVKVAVDDIMFTKKEGHYLELHLCDNKPIKLLRASVKEFLEMVDSIDFIQVHRSYVVNKKYINQYSIKEIFIKENKIPVSSSFAKEILDKL